MIPMVLEAWAKRGHENLLFLTYEEMKSDLDPVVARLAAFLGVPAPDGDRLARLKAAVSLDAFRANRHVNKSLEIGPDFVRRGVVGDWKGHFTEGVAEEWDRWAEEETKGSGFNMVFE